MIQLIAWIQFWIIVSAALAVLYIGFCWVMRRDERFAIHRFALLAIILFSLSTPFLMTGVYKLLNIIDLNRQSANALSNANRWNGVIINVMHQPVATKSGFPFPWHWLSLAVIGISVVLMSRFIYQLVKLMGVYRQSEVHDFGEFRLVKSGAIQQPFSFWQWIFVPVNFNHDNDQNEILEHEKIHVSQMHSFDLLLVELLAAAMWFNPVMWMIRKRIRLIHEYLADEGALSTGIDARRYKALLLNQVTEERLICLSSSFNHSLIKKRMIMISKNKSNEKSSMRLLAFVPLSLLMLALVMGLKGLLPDVAQASTKAVKQVNNSMADSSKAITSTSNVDEGRFYILDGEKVKDISHVNPNDIIVTQVPVDPSSGTLVFTKKSKVLIIVDGVEQPQSFDMNALDPNTIKYMNVIHDSETMKKYTSKKYDAVVEINTQPDLSKKQTVESVLGNKFTYFVDGKKIVNDGSWPEGMHAVVVDTVTNTVNFYTNSEAVNTKKEESQTQPDFSTTQIFVDGVEQTDKDILSKIDNNTIESVSVKKDSVAIMKLTNNKYDAIIEITTKKSK